MIYNVECYEPMDNCSVVYMGTLGFLPRIGETFIDPYTNTPYEVLAIRYVPEFDPPTDNVKVIIAVKEVD